MGKPLKYARLSMSLATALGGFRSWKIHAILHILEQPRMILAGLHQFGREGAGIGPARRALVGGHLLPGQSQRRCTCRCVPSQA